MDADKRTHIAMIPNPGAGHLIPLAHFARHLLLHNPSLFFTFIIIPSSSSSPSSSTTTPSALTVLPATAFHVIHLPPPSFPAPFRSLVDEILTRTFHSINRSLLPLRQTLQDMTRQGRLAALIVDQFATEIIDVGSELGIKSYVFFSASGIALSLFLHLATFQTSFSDDEWALDTPLEMPGCPILRVKDIPEPFHDRSSIYYKWLVDHGRRFESAEAVVLNSFHALEEEPIRAMMTLGSKLPVYAVGPLVGSVSKNDGTIDPSGCLRWLDDQPEGSVLYISFGSGGTLSTDQVAELAWGLELSEQRFLWVVRSPNDSIAFGTYFSLDEKMDPLGFLPRGFQERTKGRGLVVPSWAPQVEILGHGSTGGFMTHCGWNSVLEGAVNGVGFAAWPLYAEQSMNAVELVEKAKIALRVEKEENGVVGRDEIAKVVKELIKGEQGRKIKQRMRIIKDGAARTMSQNGFSNAALSKLLAHLHA